MNERETLATQALIKRYSELLELYHEAYTAHHGERGPTGCPCCAEFMPRIFEAMAAVAVAIEAWEAAPH